MSGQPAGRLVKLTSRPTEPEAAIIVAALRDAGIKASLSGQFTAGFRAEAPGWVSVNVLEADQPAAAKVLEELRQEPFDWGHFDVGFPVD